MSVPQFLLFTTEEKEVLISVSSIWKIEVSYPQHDPKTGRLFGTSLNYGSKHPDGTRMYKFFYGDQTWEFLAKGGEPVSEFLWKIYKAALRHGEQETDES